ncbi:hypothetical protein [Enterovibrio nigricans]|uniref:Uncharacterized protein n=1 Tax=Enterovibrio nigricans DSM 22720 TaxID=1121868 RepID=A0A1T4UE41_9GAMM|nr:hypothetical protein [Enterovibrio nigricans]PKF50177.1 hypothetical protein AT251_13405 [Enterovibrio nigricans]SKA50944.1 hypothetical protein SAMN02745132_01519 [Enterovibrio nigricans DSM 22720]
MTTFNTNTAAQQNFTFVFHDPYEHNVILDALRALGVNVNDGNVVFLNTKNDNDPISEIYVSSSNLAVAQLLHKLNACHLVECQYREDGGFLEYFIEAQHIDAETLVSVHEYYECLNQKMMLMAEKLEEDGIQLYSINELLEANFIH